MSKCARYEFGLSITDNLCNGIPHCVSREQNININKTKKASKRRQKRKTLFDQQTKQLSQPSIQPVSQTPIKVSDVSVLNTDRNKTVAHKSSPLAKNKQRVQIEHRIETINKNFLQLTNKRNSLKRQTDKLSNRWFDLKFNKKFCKVFLKY